MTYQSHMGKKHLGTDAEGAEYEVPADEPWDPEKSLKMDQAQIEKEAQMEEPKKFKLTDVKGGHQVKLEFQANKNIMKKRIEVQMVLQMPATSTHPLGGCAVVDPLVMRTVEPGDTLGDPFLSISYEAAEALMNELWSCGIRPTDVGSPGELGATKAHLADMRKIVFEVLDLKK